SGEGGPMKKTRTLKVRRDFVLSRTNYRSWSDDLVASVMPWFAESNQTPCLALGKSVGKVGRRAIVKSFRKMRERVTITSTIPRTARCVAADLSVHESRCSACVQPIKALQARLAFAL